MNTKLAIRNITIDIGIEKPFRILHSTDNHICVADERDCERKRDLSSKRAAMFGSPVLGNCDLFDESIRFAKENELLFLSTGDICDFVSYGCLDYAKKKLSEVEYVFAPGNHEFSKFVGEAKEDAAYKADSYGLVQAYFKNNLTADSTVINGLNIVTFDNSYYNFTDSQTAFLEKQVKKGLPIALAFHVPIYTEGLYNDQHSDEPGHSCYCIACPESKMHSFPKDRYEQQLADKPTLDFVEYAKAQPLIKAVFAGHLHFFRTDILGTWAAKPVQICSDGGFHGAATLVEIK